MNIKTSEKLDGKVTVLAGPQRLDASKANDFRDKLTELVERKKFQLVIDLSETEFIDSSGLGALVSRIAVIRANQGDVRLVFQQEFVYKLLALTHLDKVFKCFESVATAVNSFA